MAQVAVEQPAPAPALNVRPMVAGDAAFVFATWLNHLKSGSAYGKALQRDTFFRSFHRTIEAILKRPQCRVYVACPEGESGIIVGYLVTDGIRQSPAIHFGFTKGAFRRLGVMRALVNAAGLDVNDCVWTQPTEAEDWVKAKWPGLEVLDLFR